MLFILTEIYQRFSGSTNPNMDTEVTKLLLHYML
jgi:hypothetical protein